MSLAAAGIALVLGCGEQPAGGPDEVVLDAAAPLTTDSALDGIRDLLVTKEGEIWVLTSREPFITVVHNDRHVHRFGRSGAGPGELRNPQALVRDPSSPSRVTVWDVGNRKLITYDASGSVEAETPWRPGRGGFVRSDIREVSYGNPFRVARRDDRYLVAVYGSLSETGDFRHGALLTTDRNGNAQDTLLDFWRDIWSRHDSGVARELVDVPHWAPCGINEVVVLEPFGPTIRWLSWSGSLLRDDTLDLPRRELTDAVILNHVQSTAELELRGRRYDSMQVRQRLREMISHNRDLFGHYEPLAMGLLCDRDGRAWVELFPEDPRSSRQGGHWVVKAPGASYLAVQMPRGFEPWHFAQDTVVGVLTDSLDLQQVAVVVLPAKLRVVTR